MQNALLGLAIAVIIALIAALTAPHFMDWSRYRPVFEAELSRILGEDVRVAGALDARLLPSPSLRLHELAFGHEGGALAGQAESLDVEFSLGDLMRGVWRANELSIRTAKFRVRLDNDGRLPSALIRKFDLSGLAVDRLNFSGAIVLEKASGDALLSLSDIAFAGEWRAMSGTLRGEGQAALAGRHIVYRLSSAMAGDSNMLKLRLGVNADAAQAEGVAPRETPQQMEFLRGPLAGDFDGAITFENGVPEYAGHLTVSRPVLLRAAKGDLEQRMLDAPWRIGGKAKLRFDTLTFEAFDLLYGAEDSGFKIGGAAQMHFGAMPRVQAVLSARQIDADRLLANDEAQAGAPVRQINVLASMAARWRPPPCVIEVHASAENVVLGGKSLRSANLDLRADAAGWNIQNLELQAPGGANLVVSGQSGSALDTQTQKAGFTGSIALDSADSASLLAWLGAQGAPAPAKLAKLTLRADVQLAPDSFSLHRIHGTFDGAAFTGNVAAVALAEAAQSRQKAAVTLAFDELDVERIAALADQMGLTRDMWPYETAFDLRAARAIWLGQSARDMILKARLSPVKLALERLAMTNPGGLSLDGSGEVDIAASTGQLQIKAHAGTMANIAQLVTPLSPLMSRRLITAAGEDRDVDARLTFDIARAAGSAQVVAQGSTQGSTDARMALDIASASLRGHAGLTARLPDGDVSRLLPGAWHDLALNLQAEFETPRDHVALSLIGADGLFAAGGAPAKMTVSLKRAAQQPFDMTATMAGPTFDAMLEGTLAAAMLTDADSKASGGTKDQTDLRLDIKRAEISPSGAGQKRAGMRLTSRIRLADDDVRLEGIDATIADSRVRGALAIRAQAAHGDLELDGDLGVDRLEAGPVLLALIGAHNATAPSERWSREPFARGVLRDWRGRIAFEALAGALAPGFESRPLRGVILGEGRTLKLAELGGNVGGGSWQGEMTLRPLDGVVFDGQFRFENVASDALPLLREGMTGRLSGAMTMTSQGRSPAALIGSLAGSGSIRLSDIRLAKLNADAFAQAISGAEREIDAASDKAGAAHAADVARAALDAAPLPVAQAEVTLVLRAGRLAVESAVLTGKGARLVMDGTYDLIANAADLRLKFEATEIAPLAGVGAPTMSILLRKAGDTFTREVDPSAFMAWMTVRGVDRETRRLESLEDARKPQAPTSARMPEAGAASPPDAETRTGKGGDEALPAIIADEPSRKSGRQNSPPENSTQNSMSGNSAPENALPESNVPLPQPKPSARSAPPRVKPKPVSQGTATLTPPQLPPPIDVRPPPGFR